jgi:hypothetical protein
VSFEKDWAHHIPITPDGPYKSQADVDEFLRTVVEVTQELSINPDHMLGMINFETGGSFDPAERNKAGSGAVGLIQIMPKTAAAYGYESEEVAAMTPSEQMRGPVKEYFAASAGQLHTLDDVYLKVLYPEAIGQPPEYEVFTAGTEKYNKNSGFDRDDNGSITVAEITLLVHQSYEAVPAAA